jgi:glucosylglycerate synthase
MASTPTHIDAATQQTPATTTGSLLVSLPPLPNGSFDTMLANLAAAFPTQTVLVAAPGTAPNGTPHATPDNIQLVPYTPTATSSTHWVLTPADYLNTFKGAEQTQASACLLLGAECQSLAPEAIRALASSITASNVDLAIARYNLGPREGLVNSAILYPLTRALFCVRSRYPLAIDLGLSLRMAERLAATAQKSISANQNDTLLWPSVEAACANCSIAEVDIGSRLLPQPTTADLNTLLAQIAGSLFAEVDARAAFWQRARGAQPALPVDLSASLTETHDIAPMLDAFHLAYANLHEIWSLVLPPNSLLGLKRLSVTPAESFNMPDSLWARIVYDFVLAYRLRTINRGHLLGALTPLYLAWVASHLVLTGNGTPPEKHIQDLAAAFEADKPYLVSRWRWPDRFNP